MTLDPNRLREVLSIFFQFFDFPDDFEWKTIPIKDILPLLEKDIGDFMLQNENQSQAIFWWLSESYHYIIGDTNDKPAFEIEYKDFYQEKKDE